MIFKSPAEYDAWVDSEAEKVTDLDAAVERLKDEFRKGPVMLENPGGDNWNVREREVKT